MINDGAVIVGNPAVVEHDERRIVVQPKTRGRGVGLRQRHAIKPFAVGQLGNERLLQQGLLFAGFAQNTLRQHAGKLNELRDFIETIKNQHQGDPFAVERGQQRRKLLA